MNYLGDEVPLLPPGADGSCDPLKSLPAVELAELADEMRTIWRTLSRDAHLTGGADQPQRQQFWVLGVLSKGPQRMSRIAERARTSQASITGIIDRLEALGFVERVRSTQDRRVVEVSLTEAGRVEMQCVHSKVAERLGKLLEPLSAEETQELLRLFHKITSAGTSCACDAKPRDLR
jgi:DNA-binding MarR family transcriptional regulator